MFRLAFLCALAFLALEMLGGKAHAAEPCATCNVRPASHSVYAGPVMVSTGSACSSASGVKGGVRGFHLIPRLRGKCCR